MKLLLQIISWIMLVLGVIATISLTVQANQGVSGNGSGIMISIVWTVQSALTLFYINSQEN